MLLNGSVELSLFNMYTWALDLDHLLVRSHSVVFTRKFIFDMTKVGENLPILLLHLIHRLDLTLAQSQLSFFSIFEFLIWSLYKKIIWENDMRPGLVLKI